MSESLNALAFGSFKATSTGRYVTSTSAANRTVTFSIPPAGRGLTSTEVGELLSQLLDLYDQSEDALISAGITSPTDAQIYTEMMDRLIPRRVVRSDFSSAYTAASPNSVAL